MTAIILIVWGISAFVAGMIAGDRDRSFFGFAAVTFFFLGPLGPGFALIATHGRIEKAQLQASGWPMKRTLQLRAVAEGRHRFICPRCGAQNDIPNADTSYDCWQCSEHRNVEPKVAKPAKS
jgi:DNA-directed RNA polymerase subunit RPC12/RpoP